MFGESLEHVRAELVERVGQRAVLRAEARIAHRRRVVRLVRRIVAEHVEAHCREQVAAARRQEHCAVRVAARAEQRLCGGRLGARLVRCARSERHEELDVLAERAGETHSQRERVLEFDELPVERGGQRAGRHGHRDSALHAAALRSDAEGHLELLQRRGVCAVQRVRLEARVPQELHLKAGHFELRRVRHSERDAQVLAAHEAAALERRSHLNGAGAQQPERAHLSLDARRHRLQLSCGQRRLRPHRKRQVRADALLAGRTARSESVQLCAQRVRHRAEGGGARRGHLAADGQLHAEREQVAADGQRGHAMHAAEESPERQRAFEDAVLLVALLSAGRQTHALDATKRQSQRARRLRLRRAELHEALEPTARQIETSLAQQQYIQLCRHEDR